MMKKITPFAAIFLLFWGCETDPFAGNTSQMGFKPVYASSANLNELIKSSSPQPLTETGKIYIKGNYLLVNRPFAGIHIFNNADPAKPINLSFLEIPGNLDVTMKGDYLYADYIGKIAVIDISDLQKPKITQTVKLDTKFQDFPPQADQNQFTWRTYFECPDPKKGTVVGWTYTSLKNPKCWRDRE